jgi:hypothetical protein
MEEIETETETTYIKIQDRFPELPPKVVSMTLLKETTTQYPKTDHPP